MRKVLVVEDDMFVAAIFTMFLRELEHELIGKCSGGREAIEFCHRQRPDVVLMDIHLEGEVDGIQTAEQLRRELDIPVIYVSSDTSSQIIKRAIVSNSYAFLVKPVNIKELGIAIDLAYYKHKVDKEQRDRESGYRQFICEASMPLMILHEGRIQYLNNLALDLFKTHYIEDILTMPYLDFVEDGDKAQFEQLLNRFNDNGQGFAGVEIAMKDVHGQSFYVSISASVVSFNNKRSLQISLKDNSESVFAKRTADVLSVIVEKSGIPFIITDGSFNIEKLSGINDIDTVLYLGKSLSECDGFDIKDNLQLSYSNNISTINFKAYPIKDASGDLKNVLFCTDISGI